ncbi:MAG: DUF4835 family protein [Saprospiraceae bacterium]
MRKFLLVFFALAALTCVNAQGELNANVRVITPQLQKYERRIFDQLENALRDFINTTKWTKDIFEPDERIKCSFIITISTEGDNNVFLGELAVQATRPVYGSGYETPLLSHLDKEVQFSYAENQPIIFQPDGTDNPNLSALIAFYAYIILALDYDSFSLYGGEPYLLMAQQIVNNIQNSASGGGPGWRAADGGKSRNRYWMIENLLNARIKLFRSAMYTYHRKGLDMFTTDMDQARSAVLSALEDIDKVGVAYFNSMIVQMFSNAKRDELIEMFKVAPKPQRERVFQIMSKADPANATRYREVNF